MTDGAVTGEGARRVLVVEDEVMIALMVEQMLAEIGYEVVGPGMRLREAVSLAETEAVDAAVLDVNLGGDRSFPVADVLRRRGVPFVFATGYGSAGLDEPYRDATVLRKPFDRPELERALAEALAGAR